MSGWRLIRIHGGTQLAQKLRRAASGGLPTVTGVLQREAEAIITAAKQQYVPVETGALRASGFVAPPQVSGNAVAVVMGFGGPAAPYALVVHEDLTKQHPVGSAKYLEIPFKARVAGMPAVLKARLNQHIRQAFQRLGNVEANLRAGRDVNWGMPAYGAA